MMKRLTGLLRSEAGGIATYVAQAVMVLAVLSVSILIIASTNSLGRFLVERIKDFMTHIPR
ncbi:MAG TPA: hypothetical protein VD902_01435 [Symbiobacteriaceae bacterium]|nr:hypothetical protein [Symbiobacteriaceae bacterium]